MKYQDHATWQMLEKSKQDFKMALAASSKFHPTYSIVEDAHNAIVKLQLALEDKLLREFSGEN